MKHCSHCFCNGNIVLVSKNKIIRAYLTFIQINVSRIYICIAPELLCDEPAYSYSDIWSVGVLTYILLSGVSPFKGCTELETRQNITFVRYRFEYLHKDLSQEATRFIMSIFKRTPT